MPDAESAASDRRAHEVFAPLVRFWLRHIANRRAVEFPWATRCVLNDAKFSIRIDGCRVELDLVREVDKTRKETGNRQCSPVRKQALDP